MITKCFEVRDRMTFVPVLAVQMVPRLQMTCVEAGTLLDAKWERNEAPDYLIRRCGYPTESPYSVLLCRLDGTGRVAVDPYDWGDRTFLVAHNHITENFDALPDGAVVDVEHILGETAQHKRSERETT